MSQENCCLDDYFPFWNCPFSGDIRSFSEGKFLSTWIASSKSFCPNMHPSLIKDWLCPENLMGNGCNFSTWWFCHLSSLDQALNTVNILEDFEVYIIFTIHTENKKQQACVSFKKKTAFTSIAQKKRYQKCTISQPADSTNSEIQASSCAISVAHDVSRLDLEPPSGLWRSPATTSAPAPMSRSWCLVILQRLFNENRSKVWM